MANNVTLSNPAIIVNGEVVKIVPGSLKYDAGEGEINVRAAAAGDTITSVHSFNAETAIGMVGIEVYATEEMDNNINLWKANIGANTINFGQRCAAGKSITRTFVNMSASAPIERGVSADGTTAIEFKGDRMVLS